MDTKQKTANCGAKEAVVVNPKSGDNVKISDLVVHRYAQVYPRMKGSRLSNFEESCRSDGIRQHVLINSKDNLLVDGRHRIDAAIKYDLPIEVDWMYLDTDDDVKQEIRKRNGLRIHLGVGELVGTEYRMGVEDPTDLVALTGASLRTVEDYLKVVERGIPELEDAVINGDIAVHVARDAAKITNGPDTDILVPAKKFKRYLSEWIDEPPPMNKKGKPGKKKPFSKYLKEKVFPEPEPKTLDVFTPDELKEASGSVDESGLSDRMKESWANAFKADCDSVMDAFFQVIIGKSKKPKTNQLEKYSLWFAAFEKARKENDKG